MGSGRYAHHAATGFGCDAAAFYFRDIEDARALLSAYPSLELADGTVPRTYTSPVQNRAWQSEHFLGVCNLYSMTKGQDATRALFDDLDDQTDNLAPRMAIYPDDMMPAMVKPKRAGC